MPAHDAVEAASARFAREGFLESADVADRILDLVLEELR